MLALYQGNKKQTRGGKQIPFEFYLKNCYHIINIGII